MFRVCFFICSLLERVSRGVGKNMGKKRAIVRVGVCWRIREEWEVKILTLIHQVWAANFAESVTLI